MTGSVTARVYRDLLRRWLLPVLEDVRAALENPLCQQGNATIHTAKLMQSFLNVALFRSSPILPTPLT